MSLRSRLKDATILWFVTMNPINDVFWALFQSDSMSQGLLPHPNVVMSVAFGRIVNKSIGCLVTAFIAPSDYPYPWSTTSSSSSSSSCSSPTHHDHSTQDKSSSDATTEGRNEGFLPTLRFFSVFFSLTSENIVDHCFSRLPTTRLARFLSNWSFNTFIAPIQSLGNAIGDRVMHFVPRPAVRLFADGGEALPVEEDFLSDLERAQHSKRTISSLVSSNSEEGGVDGGNVDGSFASKEAYDEYAYECFSHVAMRQGPIRTSLFRNFVPVASSFVQEQLMWFTMSLLSQSRLFRRLVIGRFLPRSALLPYSHVWRLHCVSTCSLLADATWSLTARALGSFLGFYLVSLASRAVMSVPSSSSPASATHPLMPAIKTSYFTCTAADGSIYGESILFFATKSLRFRFVQAAHSTAADFLNKHFPFDVPDQEEDADEEGSAPAAASSEDDPFADEEFVGDDRRAGAGAGAESFIGDEEFEQSQRAGVFTEEDYYAVLGIERSASRDEIRKAYLNQAKACHPDRLSASPTHEREAGAAHFKKVQQSYEVLSNESRRSEYDAAQDAGVTSPSSSNYYGPGAGFPGGNPSLHPGVIAQRYFAYLEKTFPHPAALNAVMIASTVGAAVASIGLLHCHAANAFRDLFATGIV